jgi:hypothetical protein
MIGAGLHIDCCNAKHHEEFQQLERQNERQGIDVSSDSFLDNATHSLWLGDMLIF